MSISNPKDQYSTSETCGTATNTSCSKDQECGYNCFKRARYFHGMLMTERDFREEQIYHDEKRKLLNRMLHGWGVVCGLKISAASPANSRIIIEPGLALDCAGNEIIVCEPRVIDAGQVLKACAPADKSSLCQPCTGAKEDETDQSKKWYVVIRYYETPSDPVPTYSPGCGCDQKTCDYSRTKEGFCIDLIPAKDLAVPCPKPLPKTGGKCEELGNASDEAKRKFICEDLLMPCPGSCCDHPQVVLGSIDFSTASMNAPVVTTLMINNWDCRKYVITFGLLQHWMIQLAPQKLPLDAIVDYPMLGEACKSLACAVETFKDMCGGEEQGKDRVKVPDVVRRPIKEAQAIVEKAGLTAKPRENLISIIGNKKGPVVFQQKPAAETEMSAGSPVDLVLIAQTDMEKLVEVGIIDIGGFAKAEVELLMKVLGVKKETAEQLIKEAPYILS